MAFGTPSATNANADSYSESYKVEVAELKDKNGTIVHMTTHGGKKETSEEFYLGESTSTITNEAINGQAGTTDIVTEHSLTEKTGEYQKVTINKVSALSGPAVGD